MQTVSTLEARNQLGKLLELAFYKDKKIKVTRNKKDMAFIVGAPFMIKLNQFVDYLIENDPALADTLAIELNDEIKQSIEQGRKEAKAGNTVPIETILDD